MQRKVLAVGGISLALALAGCGGSAQSGSSGGSFVANASAVCTSARKSADSLKVKGLDGLLERVVVYQAAKARGLSRLDPPQALKGQYARYLAVIAMRRDELAQFRGTHPTKVPKAFLKRGTQLQAQEDKLAGVLGLKLCRENQ